MKNITTLMIVLLFTACNSPVKQKKEVGLYDKNSLSFLIPKNWEVEKDTEIDGIANSRFLTLIKDRQHTDGEFIVITAIDSGISLNRYMDILIQQSEGGYAKRKVEFTQLTDPTESLIGSKKIVRVEFETKINDNRNKETLTAFYSGKKTFAFVTSAESTSANEHLAVVDAIIKSLKIN